MTPIEKLQERIAKLLNASALSWREIATMLAMLADQCQTLARIEEEPNDSDD